MIISEVLSDLIIPLDLKLHILESIEISFAERYSINNSKWFTPKYKHEKLFKLNPIVVNTAEYISKRFQNQLVKNGWIIEETIDNQTIDGYIDFSYDKEWLKLDKNEFLEAISYLDVDREDYLKSINHYYNCFYKKSFPFNAEYFNRDLENLGFRGILDRNVKIGLEFETGNIASSFRAISKLNYLYDSQLIDIGVFITSDSKHTATSIWPSSNRNGSIEELESRKFRTQIKFPSIILGFCPEEYSKTSPYLNRNGKIDIPLSDETLDFKGKKYVWDAQKKNLILIEKQ